MDDYIYSIGKRLRAYRLQRGLTQEALAERAELHPTYIGQAERGEKNLTLQSLARLLTALNVSPAEFFATDSALPADAPARRCYELLLGRTPAQQEQLYRVLFEANRLIK